MKIGDTVRLRNRKRRAQIVEVLPDIKGGVKLDRPLDGFRYWNKNDLVKIDRQAVRVPATKGGMMDRYFDCNGLGISMPYDRAQLSGIQSNDQIMWDMIKALEKRVAELEKRLADQPSAATGE